MKKIFNGFIVLVLLCVLTSAGVHKYYVAVFQLEYVPKKKEVQMASRLFIDDLEAAMNKKYGKKFYFCTPKELPEATDYLKQYFAENIHIKINGNAGTLKYLGRETEDDVLICYYTLPAEKAITTLNITNTVLLEAYSEQQNIIHAKVNGAKKSLMLTNDTPTGTLDF